MTQSAKSRLLQVQLPDGMHTMLERLAEERNCQVRRRWQALRREVAESIAAGAREISKGRVPA